MIRGGQLEVGWGSEIPSTPAPPYPLPPPSPPQLKKKKEKTKIVQGKIFRKKALRDEPVGAVAKPDYPKRVYYFQSVFSLNTSTKGWTLFFWKYRYYNASVNILSQR